MRETASDAPALFFAPFVSSTLRVEPEWIDYNGHLNVAYYGVLFDRASDEAFELVGLGPEYAARRGASFFVVETHATFRREVREGDPLRATVQLVDVDDKRIHAYLELRHAREGWLAATSETLSVHVDTRARRAAAFPSDVLANLALMKAAHARIPRAEHLGRRIAMRRAREDAPEPVALAH